MAITNLTNTKWVINETPDISSTSELFNLTFNSNGNSYTKFNLGVFDRPTQAFQLHYVDANNTNTIVCDTNNGWSNEAYRIISITGGTDVSNQRLLIWLSENATQVPVVDLTNTKWVFNPTIEYDSNFPDYNNPYSLTYKAYYNNGANYDTGTSLYMAEYVDSGHEPEPPGPEPTPPEPSMEFYGLLGSELQSFAGAFFPNCIYEGYLSTTMTPTSNNQTLNYIEITSGTDIANPDLIVWLSQNATLQPSVSVKTFDLSTLQLSAGTHVVQVRARGSGYRDSEFSNSVSYEAGQWSCVVAGLGSENPSNVTFTHTGTMPTFEEVTVNSNVFIKIPKMYRKVLAISNNQITSFEIANYKKDNSFVPYTCFVKEDGTTEMDYVLIGKYFSNSTSVMNSVNTSGETQQIGNARTHAQALGTGYQLYDWQMHKLWQDLIICKKNTINTNSGSGIGTNKYDDFGIYWDIWSGFVDGVLAYRGYWKFSYKPSEYVTWSSSLNPTNYIQANYGIPNGYREIKKLGYDSSHPFFNYPSSSVSVSSYTTYYCDQIYTPAETETTTRPVIAYVTGNNTPCGAFGCDIFETSGTYDGCARLCYRPI